MIIDHVDKLELPDDRLRICGNELRSLKYLAQGLQFLYGQVKGIEDQITDAVDRDKTVFIFGNDPLLRSVPQGLVACAFHWYAVSSCNYVRLVGWLAHGGDSKKAGKYVEQILPEVRVWRNKVGAHFARTDPSKEDSAADLAVSVIFPIGFEDDAFYACPLKLAISQGGSTSTSRGDIRWSLTRTHRGLAARYWPNTLESMAPHIDAGLTLVAGARDVPAGVPSRGE